jgi:hypothetical protein
MPLKSCVDAAFKLEDKMNFPDEVSHNGKRYIHESRVPISCGGTMEENDSHALARAEYDDDTYLRTDQRAIEKSILISGNAEYGYDVHGNVVPSLTAKYQLGTSDNTDRPCGNAIKRRRERGLDMKGLTWDELAAYYDKEHSSRKARTLPMDTVWQWAMRQKDKFELQTDGSLQKSVTRKKEIAFMEGKK